MDNPREAKTVALPLGAFPHLAPGSIWVDGVFEGVASHQLLTVQVEFPETLPNDMRAKSLHDLAPDYPLHDLPHPSWCRLVTTSDGIELVVPSSELIRAWYFFDSLVIPAVIAGAITNPRVLSHRHLPWIPELSYAGPDGTARIVHKNRLSIPSAQCLSRLLFDSKASEGAKFISKWMRTRLEQSSIPLPPALPPIRGSATWDVRCVPTYSPNSGRPRYLVTQLLGSDESLPYDRLERLNQTDLRPGTSIRDELEPIIRSIRRNIFEDPCVLDIYGDGVDDSLLGVEFVSLAFANSAVKVKTFVPAKGEQTHRGIWTEDGTAEVDKASVDPTAEHEDAVPPSSQSNVPSYEKPLTQEHEIKIAPLFEDVLNEICQHPALSSENWTTCFPFGARTVKIHNSSRNSSRSFVVASISNGLRHIYLLDAEPNKSESFRVVAVERRFGGAVPEFRLRQWLANFPYRPGCPWQCEESTRLRLIFKYMKHPGLRSTPENMEAKFRELIRKRVLELVLG